MASGDASKLFDPAEEAPDQVAVFVLVLIEMALDEAMAPWWNDRRNPFIGEVFENAAGFTAGEVESGYRLPSGEGRSPCPATTPLSVQ